MSHPQDDKRKPHGKFATKLIHFGAEIDEATGASSVPLYQASTFHQA